MVNLAAATRGITVIAGTNHAPPSATIPTTIITKPDAKLERRG